MLSDVPEPNKQTEGLLLLSPGLLHRAGVVTVLTLSICLGWLSFRNQEHRSAKAKAAAAHEHPTAQQRDGRALKTPPSQEIIKIFF